MSQFYVNGAYVKFRAKGKVAFGYIDDYSPLNGLYKIKEEITDKLKSTFIDDTHWVTKQNICRSYDEFDDNGCFCGSESVKSQYHQPYCPLYRREL